MPLKLKGRPEDFIVEEIADLPLEKNCAFGVYLLKKRGWNTIELLLELSHKLNIPFKYFSYGGRKDRHALTRQYVSIKSKKIETLEEENYSLEFIGWMKRPMGPDLIKGNKFEVIVRKLNDSAINKALSEIEEVNLCGFPNYFDDQRFGSYDPSKGFFAEKVLKQQFNGALKAYLTSCFPGEKKEKRHRKEFFFGHWRNWKACSEKAKTTLEKKAFSFLLTQPNGFLKLLKEIPRYELTAFIASYQAYLWNEILRKVISTKILGTLKYHQGVAGNYIFYSRLSEEEAGYFENLSIPVPGPKNIIEDALLKSIYAQVLETNGIKNAMFNKMKLRQAFFKSFGRSAIARPMDFVFEALGDELYPGSKKLILKFFLFRGSFATMLIKRIFAKGTFPKVPPLG